MLCRTAVLAILPWLLRAAEDPFAGIEPSRPTEKPVERQDWTFKRELFSQFSYGSEEHQVYSRQSVGFELLRKFSSATATVASVDAQLRFVRRDHPVETSDDMEGMHREGWAVEVHNLYVDFYNVAGPPGRVNVRAGRFYLPFGLNLATDTHGTVLQLSNERSFGYERDWYTGFWGSLGRHLNYDLYGMLGGGPDLAFRGQSGLLGARIGLSGLHRSEQGLEAGLSFLGGERVSREAVERSPSVAARAGRDAIVDTHRAGADLRCSHGPLSGTAELSRGHDGPDDVLTQLYQMDYLRPSRRWGLSAQYRRFWQDLGTAGMNADASAQAEFAWYFKNDLGGASVHAIRLDVERQLERQQASPGVVVTLQYYLYW